MKYTKFVAGVDNESTPALKEHILTLNLSLSYAKMISNRVEGLYKNQCTDVYFVAHDNGKMFSRLWHGWGNHNNSIGNFGNFLTIEEARGMGIGREMLKMWCDDIKKRENLPLGLFCSAGSKELVKLYSKFGFRLAVRGTEVGPLYKPLGESPETFVEFCEKYYTPTDKIYAKKANVEYRHEIDCLLKFALLDNGLKFGFDEVSCIEEIFAFDTNFSANILFTSNDRVAGWQIILPDGTVKTQVYPIYNDVKIENVF